MNQLLMKFYNRNEISEILEVDNKNNPNFARKIKDTLSKWGYSFNYSRKGVEITRVPTTPEEKLSEMMARRYDLDIQVYVYEFACFLYLLGNDSYFVAMPWKERVVYMGEYFSVDVCEKTLKNWGSKLIKSGDAFKDNRNKVYWMTYRKNNGETIRQKVEEDDTNCRKYFADKQTIFRDRFNVCGNAAEAWKYTFEELWVKYGCCYYACSSLILDAVGTQELFELVETIAEGKAKKYRVVHITRLEEVGLVDSSALLPKKTAEGGFLPKGKEKKKEEECGLGYINWIPPEVKYEVIETRENYSLVRIAATGKVVKYKPAKVITMDNPERRSRII